jgi:regulator of replication initiation timing
VEFKREIEKARKQAVKAVEEKRRLEEEFGKLRRQLYRAGSKQKE